MTKPRQNGFTLIELMVGLAVAAILLGIGVPSFVDAMQNSRISAQYNQAARSFFYARSEAVKSSDFVVVCARADIGSEQCGGKDDWANGWIVFVDVASSRTATATVGTGDTILALEPAISNGNTVFAKASLSSGGTPDKVPHIRYHPRGNADWTGGSLVVCDAKRGAASSLALNVKLTGSIETARPITKGGIPHDAFNKPIDYCETSS